MGLPHGHTNHATVAGSRLPLLHTSGRVLDELRPAERTWSVTICSEEDEKKDGNDDASLTMRSTPVAWTPSRPGRPL